MPKGGNMGDAIKFVQTATISTGGTLQIVYTHDPTGKASKVGVISAYVASGTQTGDVSIKYGNDITNTVEIAGGQLSSSSPSLVFSPNFVIHPGQVIIFDLATITAGDVVRVMVGGH